MNEHAAARMISTSPEGLDGATVYAFPHNLVERNELKNICGLMNEASDNTIFLT
jgi:hypothetical protein